MTKSILPLLLIPLMLSGCMSMSGKPRVVILQNPQTMEFKNCEVSKLGFEKHYRDNDKCVEEYMNQGYVIWGSR